MKQFLQKLIPRFFVNSYHWLRAMTAALFYGFPARKLTIIGVTGTNGKTTTAHLIASVLEGAGMRTALATTVDFKIGNETWVNETKMTTISSAFLQDFLRKALFAGCTHIVLEISSHALAQNRVAGIKFDTAVFTNLSHEHLDYHKTMEKYFQAKEKMFKKARAVVVNGEDEFGRRLLKYGKGKYEFRVSSDESRCSLREIGIPASDVAEQIGTSGFRVSDKVKSLESCQLAVNSCRARHASQAMRAGQLIVAENITTTGLQTTFSVKTNLSNLSNLTNWSNLTFSINFPGKYNVQNALAAICVGLSQNINLATIAKGLKNTQPVPGRAEFIEAGQNFKVMIDYAVTPDSLQKLFYEVIKPLKPKKVIWVFGSCGERDKEKRPLMGKIVGSVADIVIVTNEDPYNENPQTIIDAVFAGVLASGKTESKNAFRIFDRGEAMDLAFSRAKKDDIVVITGKGAETTMAVGKKRIPWDERKIVNTKLRNAYKNYK